MQNKGLVKLFAILFGLVSIYQLSFTFKANSLDEDAIVYAKGDVEKERQYLDSIANEKVYSIGIADYTYNEVKENAMNLGLDLKGGVSVILQVSVKDILKGLANYSKDPVFNKALDDASELQKNSQSTYLQDFFIAFDKIKGDTKLASPDIFANRTLSEEITFDMTDDEVKPIIERKIDESIVSAFEVLRKRIDEFGVTSPSIQRLGTSGRILVELPGVKDVQRATTLLQSTAQLEFWDAYKGEQFMGFLNQANELLKEIEAPVQETTTDENTEVTQDSEDSKIADLLGTDPDSTDVESNPIGKLIRGFGYQGGPIVAQFAIKDKDKVLEYLNMPQVRALIPAEMRNVKFVFGKPEKDSEIVDLYALIRSEERRVGKECRTRM